MQRLPMVKRVSKIKKSRRRHRHHRKTQQKPNVVRCVRDQKNISKSSETFAVVENIESMPSTPVLSIRTMKQPSTNVSVIRISQCIIVSAIDDKHRSKLENNSLQKLNMKSEHNDVQKPMTPLNMSDNSTTHFQTPSARIHSIQSARDLDSINPKILSTSTIDITRNFHSAANTLHATSKTSLFDFNNRKPYIVGHDKEENKEKRRRRRRGGWWTLCCSPCCCLLTGLLLALFLAALTILIAVLITLKTKSTTTTTTTTTSTSTSTTSTSATTTTSTSSTSSSSSSTSTSSTTSTSTSSTSTSSTTSTSTSSTSTSSTASTSTSSTSSSTTSITTTSVTTITTTTTAATVSITSNTCTSGWNGVTVLYHCDNCADIVPYAQYTYTYTAISNRTRIAFSFREDDGCFALDDVSVRNMAAPTVELISNTGFETGTLSSWTYCNPSGASNAGEVIANSDNFICKSYIYQAQSGTYFYYDGAVGNCDYLIQTFPTIIGNTYTISYWLYNRGVGAQSSADVIISI